MNKSVKVKSRKLSEIKENRENRRFRKKLKVEKVEEEVIGVIAEEGKEDEDENICSESEESVVVKSEESVVGNSDEDDDNYGSESDVSENDGKSDESESIASESEEEEEEEKVEIPKSKKRKTKYNPVEEARLERLVFGDPSDVIKNLLESGVSTKKPDDTTIKPDPSTEKHDKDIAKNLPPSLTDDSDDDDSKFEIKTDSEDEKFGATGGKNRVAWIDDDDTEYSVQTALKEQHRKLPKGRPEKVYTELLENKFTQLVGTPKWASLDGEVKDEDEDADLDREILKRSNHLVVSKVKKLRKGIIDIKALTDINKSTHTEGPIVTSLEFHPTSTVAMVAGLSGILSLFQVDGRENTKLQSICFENFRIHCAKFLREGSEIISGSRNCSYSQAYDLMSGKTYKIPLPHGVTNMQKFEVSPDGKFIAIAGRMGQIHLLSSATKELVANFKMNKRCLALAFSPDSEKLVSHGDSDQMYIWDLKSRSCMHKAIDDGCIASEAVAFSPSGQFIATGSKQGVVNIYETESVLGKKNPIPLKIILNLVTPISRLKFNPTSEILAMASKFKENAFKILHIPSFTVFANFPTFRTKMYNPLEIDFSPSSGYVGLSNNKGHAYLYRLKHYGNY